MKVEYRVRPVTRYIVTRYHESDGGRTGGCEPKGEFDNEETASAVGYALAKEEHARLGYPVGDERIKYPEPSHQLTTIQKADRFRKMADELRAMDAQEKYRGKCQPKSSMTLGGETGL